MDGRLGRRFPIAALAWQNLTRQRARSLLAMAGITIGVVAIASLGMFGATLEISIEQSFQDSASSVWITPGDDLDDDTFDADQVALIERSVDNADVHAVRSETVNVTAIGGSTSVQAVSLDDPGEFATAAEGRIPSPWRTGSLVGGPLADRLDLAAGDSLQIEGRTVRVAAVLEGQDQFSVVSTDNSVLLPERQFAGDGVGLIVVRAENPQAAFETARRLRQEVNFRQEIYDVNDAEAAIEQFNEQLGTIQTFLIGVGAVSLLVAAVSILNVMLMSTIERKGEIGVLRAVGYYRRDILRLMLTEALLLGVVGAGIGLVASGVMGMLINDLLLGDPYAFTSAAIGSTAQGFAFGVIASVVSGAYPAWKAANARPVEALRD